MWVLKDKATFSDGLVYCYRIEDEKHNIKDVLASEMLSMIDSKLCVKNLTLEQVFKDNRLLYHVESKEDSVYNIRNVVTQDSIDVSAPQLFKAIVGNKVLLDNASLQIANNGAMHLVFKEEKIYKEKDIFLRLKELNFEQVVEGYEDNKLEILWPNSVLHKYKYLTPSGNIFIEFACTKDTNILQPKVRVILVFKKEDVFEDWWVECDSINFIKYMSKLKDEYWTLRKDALNNNKYVILR